MKIMLFAAIICVLTTTKPLSGQHTQSLSFSGPTTWTPGSTVTLDVILTYGGYDTFGLSYWLEVPNAVAPFISITGAQYFHFPDPNQTSPNPAPFNSTAGSIAGYMCEVRDLGATVNDPIKPPPITTFHITTI